MRSYRIDRIYKYHFILLMVIGILLFNSCSANSDNFKPDENSSLPDHIQENYELVWSDEFEGNDIDLTKWNYRAEGSTRHYGIVSRNTIQLDGKGNVAIQVTKDESGKYYIGQLGTQKLFETTFGYFECRAKMNKQLGPHVAFWLQSPEVGNTTNNPQKYGAELDVFEYHLKQPQTVHHNIHWNGYGEQHKSIGTKVNLQGIKEGFHTFGMEWTKDEYIFYVDGVESWRTTTAVSHRSQYLILSTELTGWGGDPELGNFPDEVIFDYVRIYKSN